ncbi:MAG: DUF305 domain-containing protein [Chloroflexota bacterium]|nr:DUF305 domain-containing protein [Chloroflexota bacterium]
MRKRTLGMLAGALVTGAVVATPFATALAQTQPTGTACPMAGEGWGPAHGTMAGGFGMGPMMGGHGPMMGRGPMWGGSSDQVGPRAGSPTDPAAHFIEEMIPHHEDAVVMADLALARAEHQEIRDLATTIKQTQTAEIEQMRRWYREWYGSEVRPSRMANMPMMGGHDAATLDGAQPFDKAFIEAMIPHHQMAVMMSTHMQVGIDKPELHDLLQSIAASQAAEIDQMRQWYQEWYGTPVPSQASGAGSGGARMPAHGMDPGTGTGMHHTGMPHHAAGAPAGADSAMAGRERSPHAGTFDPNSTIRALTPSEIADIRAGAGAGLARAAELNGYPGPRHVLDLADRLGLSEEQRLAVQGVYDRMAATAPAAGQRFLDAQARLEEDLRAGTLTTEVLPTRITEAGQLQSALQSIHLEAHLATAAILTPEQIAAYDDARGYVR